MPCSTFNWTVPFCSYLMCVIFTLGTVVLYLVPLKFLLLAWGKISSKTLLIFHAFWSISLWRICYKNQAYFPDKLVFKDPIDLKKTNQVYFSLFCLVLFLNLLDNKNKLREYWLPRITDAYVLSNRSLLFTCSLMILREGRCVALKL